MKLTMGYDGLMRRGIFFGLSGLVLVILESSFLAWPWLLWWLYWWRGKVDQKWLVWGGLICGLILDALMVRPVGLGAAILILFTGGWWLARRQMAGNKIVEVIWMIVGVMVWMGVYEQKITILPVMVGAVLVGMNFGARFKSDISLRNYD